MILALILAVAPLDDLAAHVGEVSHEETIARIEAYVAAHPNAEDAGRALLLGAQLRRKDGKEELARALLQRVPASSSSWLDASLALADLDLFERHFEAAIARYDALAASSPGRWQYQAALGAGLARAAQTRVRWVLAIMLGLVMLTAWRLFKSGRRALWPLPEEARIGLPIAALLALASLGQPSNEAHAVQAVALGGAALLWCNASYFQEHPPRGWRRPFEALLGVGQAVGLLFCAVVLSGLWAKFVETVTAGAE